MKTNIQALLVLMALLTFSGMEAQTGSTPTTAATEEDEFAKKKVETKISEVIPTDSVGAGELMKRAEAYFKAEHNNYKISNGSASPEKAECVASFPVKPKELNPVVDYTGKVTMKILIEFKSSKYRYTITEIKHLSKNGKCTAGSVDNKVPECGSQGMTDVVWKKLRGEMLTGASKIASDIKIAMSTIVAEPVTDDW